ncbi:MAG: hypothetical protein GY799_08885 [Desulfobulbaceae bacterium]|nr:hypothetical protein [Desulfobulbaceae bacterium]
MRCETVPSLNPNLVLIAPVVPKTIFHIHKPQY